MLLDRIDELPLRHHEIRGNPAGLLARLLRRIDALKAEAVSPRDARRLGRASAVARRATRRRRESARREREFAALYAEHDRILAAADSLDSGDVVLALGRLLAERADVRREIAERFRFLMVDELEDATLARWALLAELGADTANLLCTLDDDAATRGPGPARRDLVSRPASRGRRRRARPHLPRRPGHRRRLARGGGRDRRPAREAGPGDGGRGAGALLALSQRARPGAGGGARGRAPDRRRGAARAGSASSSTSPAATEARSPRRWRSEASPSGVAGPAALFRRPEVRDAIAWLRLLADPDDSAAAARALTRPPVELRSVDLARLTTISRRRKLDMASAAEAALESPQVPQDARERIQNFLKLYRAASAVMEERRADVFVRRLVERIGLRRQRLFAAQPETAERLLSLSRLAELASAWTRREPQGSTRDFVRYVSAVADAGVGIADDEEAPTAGAVRVIALADVKGLEFEHVYLLGLDRASMPGAAPAGAPKVPPELLGDAAPQQGPDAWLARRRRALYVAMNRAASGLVLSWVEVGPHRGQAPLAVLRGGAHRARRHRGDPRRGAVRARRGCPRDLPDAARRGPGGLLEGGPRALGASPRHRDRRQPGDRPLPGAAEAGGAGAAPRRRAGRRRDRRDQRAAAPGRHPRAAGRAGGLGAGRVPARRGARARPAPRADRRPRASPRWRPSCPAAATGWRSRPPIWSSTGPAR